MQIAKTMRSVAATRSADQNLYKIGPPSTVISFTLPFVSRMFLSFSFSPFLFSSFSVLSKSDERPYQVSVGLKRPTTHSDKVSPLTS